MGKALRIDLDGRVMSLKEAVRHLVASGHDNAAIHGRLDGFTTSKTLGIEISHARRALRTGEISRRLGIDLDKPSSDSFEREAAARGVSIGRLMRETLRSIVAGNLFDAVLDGELPRKEQKATA